MNRVKVEVVLKVRKTKQFISVEEVYLVDNLKNLKDCVRSKHSHNGGKEYIGYAIKDIKDIDCNSQNCCLYLDDLKEFQIEFL